MLERLTQKPLTELWVTEVGSVMWGMNTFASDHDYVVIYACHPHDVLIGKMVDTLPQKTFENMAGDGKPCDVSAMEIGHLVHLLKKGNINAIWATMSPRIVSSRSTPFQRYHAELKKLVVENSSKMSYFSVRGMALSQIADATKRASVRDPAKSYATAVRTLEFGTHLFETGTMMFVPPSQGVFDEDRAARAMRELESAAERTSLPDQVPEKPFDGYLLRLRLQMLVTS